MKVQFNILASQHLIHRIDTILSTWGKDLTDIIFYSDYEDKNKNVIKTTISLNTGQYDSCPEKLYNRLRQIKENNIYDWYVFVDDDTFAHTSNINNFLNTAKKDESYGSPANWGYPQGGAGFILSNETIDKIVLKDLLYYEPTRFSDEFIGFIFKDNNLNWTWIDGMYHNPALTSDISKRALTLHPLKDKQQMLLLYEN
jgi:hypothetical protein